MDRNKLEQDALAFINKGNLEGALKAFTAMLKLDPKDRRVRQRVGELQLKMGRPIEAEKMLREVAEGLVREGQGRAAVAVYKQILTFKSDDPSLHYDLGDCYATSGYPNDGRQHFDTAARLYSVASRHIDAARAMKRIVDLQPGEVALKLKVAEHLEAGQDIRSALQTLREVMDDYRRRGRPDEVGRIAEVALRLAPDDAGLHLDVGAARLEAGEVQRALPALLGANTLRPDQPRTLAMLARAYEEAGDVGLAVATSRQLARIHAAAGDVPAELEALRRAARLAPGDSELRARLQGVERQMHRLDRRLTALQLAQATTEDELRVQVKAEVLARYGLFDRAIALLRNSPDTLPLLAVHAEVLALSGDAEAAVRMADAIAPKAGRERDAVFDRVAVLRGLPEEEANDELTPIGSPLQSLAPGSLEPLPSEVAEVVAVPAAPAPPAASASTAETALARGDRLAAASDIPGALAAYRDALTEDPRSEIVVARIADLRNAARAASPAPTASMPARTPVPVAPATSLTPSRPPDVAPTPSAAVPAPAAPRGMSLTPPPVNRPRALPPLTLAPGNLMPVAVDIDPDPFAELEDGTLTEISPDSLVPRSPVKAAAAPAAPSAGTTVFPPRAPAAAASLDEAHSLVEVGMNDEALALIGDDPRLEARVLVAKALRAKGNATGALDALRDATNEARETDPGYAEALFELSGLYTATGKHRSGLRLLEELADLAPDFRPRDVQARMAGLSRLVK